MLPKHAIGFCCAALLVFAAGALGVHKARLRFDRAYQARHLGADWSGPLLRQVAGADAVRFRTGGLCHRSPDDEKVLFTLRDAPSVSNLLSHIRVTVPGSLAGCLCCGDVTVEFLRGNRVLAAVSIHHSALLRWPGNWPADAPLTVDSRDYLATLLASNGYGVMRAELDEYRLRIAASRKRLERQKALLPEDLYESLFAARSDQSPLAIMEDYYPDPVVRARVCYRLLGCTRITWGIAPRFDAFLFIKVIRKIDPAALVMALQSASNDTAAVSGAGYALMEDEIFTAFSREQKNASLSIIAPVSLRHARAENRRATMIQLARSGTGFARSCLRDALLGRLEIESLPPDESVDPSGTIFCNASTYYEPTRYCHNDTTVAAYLLATLGDASAKDRIAGLLADARAEGQGADEAALEAALRLLEKAGDTGPR